MKSSKFVNNGQLGENRHDKPYRQSSMIGRQRSFSFRSKSEKLNEEKQNVLLNESKRQDFTLIR